LEEVVKRTAEKSRSRGGAKGAATTNIRLSCVNLGTDSMMGHAASHLSSWSKERGWHTGPAFQSTDTFDVVTMQFALHYMFQSAERLKQFFTSWSSQLKEGGRFVATTMDSGVVLEHTFQHPQANPVTICDAQSRPCCSMLFDESVHRTLMNDVGYNSTFQLRYEITLTEYDDSKGMSTPYNYVEAPEWVVIMSTLVDYAWRYGNLFLETNESLNFHHYFQKYSKNTQYNQLLSKMGVIDGNNSGGGGKSGGRGKRGGRRGNSSSSSSSSSSNNNSEESSDASGSGSDSESEDSDGGGREAKPGWVPEAAPAPAKSTARKLSMTVEELIEQQEREMEAAVAAAIGEVGPAQDHPAASSGQEKALPPESAITAAPAKLSWAERRAQSAAEKKGAAAAAAPAPAPAPAPAAGATARATTPATAPAKKKASALEDRIANALKQTQQAKRAAPQQPASRPPAAAKQSATAAASGWAARRAQAQAKSEGEDAAGAGIAESKGAKGVDPAVLAAQALLSASPVGAASDDEDDGHTNANNSVLTSGKHRITFGGGGGGGGGGGSTAVAKKKKKKQVLMM
jgi:hypothetical protein